MVAAVAEILADSQATAVKRFHAVIVRQGVSTDLPRSVTIDEKLLMTR